MASPQPSATAFADLVAAKLSDRSIRALAATAAVAVVTALVGVATGERPRSGTSNPAEAGASCNR